jgi:hypothetical protein
VNGVALEGPGLPTGGWYQAHFIRDGVSSDAEQVVARRHHVTLGYLATLGIRLLAGRDLSADDVAAGRARSW